MFRDISPTSPTTVVVLPIGDYIPIQQHKLLALDVTLDSTPTELKGILSDLEDAGLSVKTDSGAPCPEILVTMLYPVEEIVTDENGAQAVRYRSQPPFEPGHEAVVAYTDRDNRTCFAKINSDDTVEMYRVDKSQVIDLPTSIDPKSAN